MQCLRSITGREDTISDRREKLCGCLADRIIIFNHKHGFGSTNCIRFRTRDRMCSRLRTRRAWKPDPESGAAIQFTVHADESVTLADNAVDGRQTQARPLSFRLSGKERVDNSEELFGGNAPLQSRSLRAGRIL